MRKIDLQLTEKEIWYILDAIGTYQQDYSVAAPVSKTINELEKKLKKSLNESR